MSEPEFDPEPYTEQIGALLFADRQHPIDAEGCKAWLDEWVTARRVNFSRHWKTVSGKRFRETLRSTAPMLDAFAADDDGEIGPAQLEALERHIRNLEGLDDDDE